MSRFFLLLISFFLFIEGEVRAQSLTLTSPNISMLVAEGEEFSRDVLLDAWDFDQRRDFGWEEGMNEKSISVGNGIWKGTTAVGGAYLFPLFPGFKNSLFAEGSAETSQLPKFGIIHRIDSSKYSWLSFKANFSSRTQLALYWESDDTRAHYWPDPKSPFALFQDGYLDHGYYFQNTDWFNYSQDLKNISSYAQQSAGSWSGNPYALRIDPSVFTAGGSVYQFDWIRLSDPNSAPFVNIVWRSASIPNDSVLFVCYVKDGKLDESIPVHRIQAKNVDGAFSFPLASLPPGTYNFFIEMRRTLGSSYTGGVLRSNYSPDIEIKPRPKASVKAPSKTSGEEYSSSIGNTWDMNSALEIKNLDLASYVQSFRQFINQSFTSSPDSQDGGSIFQAVSEVPLKGNAQTDAQIHLDVSKSKQIDADEYIYLNYRIAIDSSQYGDIADKVRNGWVMRPIWWKGNIPKVFDTAKAHIVYEGWHDYVVDLNDSDTLETGTPWSRYRFLDNLRLDPLETTLPTWFYIDYVKLFAKNRSSSGLFKITYNLKDANNVKVELYYDVDKLGYDGTKIGSSLGLSSGDHSYLWETSSIPLGAEYYIYLVVTDQFGTSRVYSDATVTIGPKTSKARVKQDFDGDGKSDPAVSRSSNTRYFVNSSLSAQSQAYSYGSPAFQPIEGDFDGDGVSDRSFIADVAGSLFWYINRSSDGVLYSRAWGYSADQPVVGDYNGNGQDEIAVYRDGAWFVLDEQDRGYAKYWGVAGLDRPIVGDFDGDEKVDLAIQRGTDGVWWILYSGFGEGYASNYYWAIQWGLPWAGDIPISTDFSGDGRSDVVVWRPGDGSWYIRDPQTNQISIIQWGLPGDEPLSRVDRNGDGKFDQGVFRPGVAMWFYRMGDKYEAIQYGLGNDRIPK